MPHVTFIHGIANKPKEKELRKLWLRALREDPQNNSTGIDLGTKNVTSSMIYWADVLYDKPSEVAIYESTLSYEDPGNKVLFDDDPDMLWKKNIVGKELEMIEKLIQKFSLDVPENEVISQEETETNHGLERVPLPWFIKRRVMKWLLKDVHHYLFNYKYSPRPGISYQVQDEIRERVLKKLNEVETDKHIVVSHSMGTVIMYDCLKRVPECPKIDGLMTIGSPLGLDEIQDKFKPEWSREKGFPEKLKGPWVNIYDALDPVATFDPNISNDYKKNGQELITVIKEQNFGLWRHDIGNYFTMPRLRAELLKLLDL